MVLDNREELSRKAYETGVAYEKTYHGCSQCVLAAVTDVTGERDDQVFRAASGLAGGLGLSSHGSCGALTGGIMAISSRYGRQRNQFDDIEGVRFKCFEISRRLVDRFESEYGSSRCGDVQTGLMGRAFDLSDPTERNEFIREGGHDSHCPTVVGNVAKWTVEILQKEEQRA